MAERRPPSVDESRDCSVLQPAPDRPSAQHCARVGEQLTAVGQLHAAVETVILDRANFLSGREMLTRRG